MCLNHENLQYLETAFFLKKVLWSILFITHQLTWALCILEDIKRVRHSANTLHSDKAAWQQFRFKHSSSKGWEGSGKLQMHPILLDCLKRHSFDGLGFYNWLLWQLPIYMSLVVSVAELEVLLSYSLQITFLHHYKAHTHLPPSNTGQPLY